MVLTVQFSAEWSALPCSLQNGPLCQFLCSMVHSAQFSAVWFPLLSSLQYGLLCPVAEWSALLSSLQNSLLCPVLCRMVLSAHFSTERTILPSSPQNSPLFPVLCRMVLSAQFSTEWTVCPRSKKTVIHFQADGMATTETLLRYKKPVTVMRGFTVCFRVKILQARDEDAIFSYAVPDEANEVYIGMNFEKQILILACCENPVYEELKIPINMREWVSICVALDLEDQDWRLSYNGIASSGKIKKAEKDDYVVRGGGMLIIGQDQDIYNGGLNRLQSLRGDLADLKVYDYVLPSSVMTSYTECSIHINVQAKVDFNNLEKDFEVMNVDTDEMFEAVFCNKDNNFTIIFPELRTFKASELVCHTSGGKLSVPYSSSDRRELFQKVTPYGEECGESTIDTFWLGIIGDPETQQWLHYDTKQPLSYTQFSYGSGLNITQTSKCVSFVGRSDTVQSRHGVWFSKDCREERCAICHFNKVAVLRARGLCPQSEFDRDYFLVFENNTISFTGVYYSQIVKNPPVRDEETGITSYGSWTLSRLDKPEIQARLEMKSPAHYPIGFNTWIVKNDKCGVRELNLVITSCHKEQFSCNEGSCVSINARCNFETDCPDGSDELGCNFLTLAPSYDASDPPARQGGEAVSVKMHMSIQSIREIDLANFQFVCEVLVVLQWTDERLQFKHLNLNDELNTISNFIPWLPKLEFLGDGQTMSDVQVRRSTLKVQRLSNPLPDNDQEVQEALIFEGRKNPLVLLRKLTVKTSCIFDLEAFPFDSQICTMAVLLSGVTKDYVRLDPFDKGIDFQGIRRGLEYELGSEVMIRSDEGNFSGLAVKLTFYSISTFYIFSTYLTTFIIMIIGYSILFFPLDAFDERIMVGLTGLLVQATLFSQVSSSIPRTAYLKLVDIWFVYCVIMLFVVCMAVAIIQYIATEIDDVPIKVGSGTMKLNLLDRKERRRQRAVRVNYYSRIVYPILSLIFIIAYVVVGYQTSYTAFDTSKHYETSPWLLEAEEEILDLRDREMTPRYRMHWQLPSYVTPQEPVCSHTRIQLDWINTASKIRIQCRETASTQIPYKSSDGNKWQKITVADDRASAKHSTEVRSITKILVTKEKLVDMILEKRRSLQAVAQERGAISQEEKSEIEELKERINIRDLEIEEMNVVMKAAQVTINKLNDGLYIGGASEEAYRNFVR
ncbi:uncharacterized protein [Palaemon carinicauda]|uniref:uncharacterized protein n=1 Tax=Palaemon carinicauda TaxID=392227 RepID=UPI0035B5BAE8